MKSFELLKEFSPLIIFLLLVIIVIIFIALRLIQKQLHDQIEENQILKKDILKLKNPHP